MRKTVPSLIVLAALAVLFWTLRSVATPPGPALASSQPPISDVSGPPVAELATSVEDRDAVRRSELPASTTPPEHQPSREVAALPPPAQARITGRILLPGGEPAADVAIKVHGWQGNHERVLTYGLPDTWVDPHITTDGEGRFALAFVAPRAYQFSLHAKLAGFAEASWRWFEILPSEVKDLGDITLAAGGAVAGRIVDERGAPASEDWMIYGEGMNSAAGGEHTRVVSAAGSDGEFRLEDLPPGPVRLTAYSQIANWIDGPVVEVRAGDTAHVDITYSGPDNRARIAISVVTRPFIVFAHDVENITVNGAGIERRVATKLEGSSQSYCVDGLPPGVYTVEIADPRFQPWSQSGVEPGSAVKAKLVGSAAVRLDVRDAASDAAVEGYGVRVRLRQTSRKPDVYELLAAGKLPRQGGTFDGLVPGAQSLIVIADGYADREIDVDLAPGEVRSIVARMSRGASLSGRVARSDGAPAQGLEVLLEPHVEQGKRPFLRPAEALSVRKTASDDAGGFVFERLPAGNYDLRCAANALVAAELEGLQLAEDEQRSGVELALPPSANLVGRVIAPPGARFDALQIEARPVGDRKKPSVRPRLPFVERAVTSPIAEDGAYRLGPLPAGEIEVALKLREVMVPTGIGGSMGLRPTPIALGQVTIESDADVTRDFEARDVFPGALSLTVHVNGSPASGLVVQAHALEPPTNAQGAAVTDHGGLGRIAALLPKQYRLSVRPVEGTWFYLVPDVVVVEPLREVTNTIQIEIVGGTLEIRADGDASPVAPAHWLLEPDSEGSATPLVAVHVKSDDKGRIQLRLPPARYRIARIGESGMPSAARVTFDWTAAGPVPPLLHAPE